MNVKIAKKQNFCLISVIEIIRMWRWWRREWRRWGCVGLPARGGAPACPSRRCDSRRRAARPSRRLAYCRQLGSWSRWRTPHARRQQWTWWRRNRATGPKPCYCMPGFLLRLLLFSSAFSAIRFILLLHKFCDMDLDVDSKNWPDKLCHCNSYRLKNRDFVGRHRTPK